MAVTQSPRLGLTRWSGGTDPFRRAQLDADHAALENLVALFSDGPFNARPAAGVRGRFYYATDTGRTYYDTGAGWFDASPAPDLSGYATITALNDGLAGKSNTGHTHTAADVNAGTFVIGRLPVAASGTSSTTQVVRADDSRLSDARTPTAHTHDDRYYTETETNDLLAGKAASVHTHTTAQVTGLDTALATKVNTDRTINPVPVRMVRSGKDANGIFTVVEEYRVGGNRSLRSALSGGASPRYTTRTVTEYGTDGATVLRTTVYTLTYDADDALTSETA